MLSEDYLIRMIQLAIAALLRITGLRKSGLYDDAQTMVDMGLEQLLGLRASRVRNLDDGRLYYMLTDDGRLDTRRLTLVSELFEAEGDTYNDQGKTAESQAAYSRALRYALEVFFQEREHMGGDDEPYILEPGEVGPENIEQNIMALLVKVRQDSLETETLWPLAGYYEEFGQYARAESILVGMAQRPELRAELLPELAEFYRRMLEKPEDQLAAGGMDPDKIRESLKNI